MHKELKYENVLELLKEIPSLITKVVVNLVSETSFDIFNFPSEKHLLSWAGLTNERVKKVPESLAETSQ